MLVVKKHAPQSLFPEIRMKIGQPHPHVNSIGQTAAIPGQAGPSRYARSVLRFSA